MRLATIIFLAILGGCKCHTAMFVPPGKGETVCAATGSEMPVSLSVGAGSGSAQRRERVSPHGRSRQTPGGQANWRRYD